MAFLVDREKHLVQVPLVPRSGTPAAQLIGIGLPELPALIAHSFVRQQNAAFRHQLFDVSVAQVKAEVEPHTVADDFGRKTVTLIRVGCGSWVHAASMARETETVQVGRLIWQRQSNAHPIAPSSVVSILIFCSVSCISNLHFIRVVA
jgi:hypothetical protein